MTKTAFLGLILAACAAVHAHAVGSIADICIIDRDSGATIPTHYFHGEYWVAGSPGRRYAILVRNRQDGRLLAVTSVDGVNVVSGATAAWDQTGYVFGAGESYQITGWRKSDAEVAAFAFTAAPNSYAARTGRTGSVGVIGVALFRERITMPPAPTAEYEEQGERGRTDAAGRASNLPVPAAQSPTLGTAHGERETSYASQTEFTRRQSAPNELIRIRYDSVENLVAMGVLMPHRYVPTAPNPFPDAPSQTFVPDPPA